MPYPPNYGGVIDVFYKVWWLHRAGVKIHLHCFTGNRQPAKELADLCVSVHYYRRRTGWLPNFSLLPYTVVSRRSAALRKNLLANDHPVLFEVLHTCWLMKDPAFAERKKIYRHSNIEHEYYRSLARNERGLFRKIFHYVEAWRLKAFEKIVRHADLILAVNEKDAAYFRKKYPEVTCSYLPSFHPHANVDLRDGNGAYALFHGNLSVAENYTAALWLAENVLRHAGVPVIIAGLRPPAFLRKAIASVPNITLVADPLQEEMDSLVRNAQVHLLYTDQPTGLKLKLLNVLFNGRFILCNAAMLSGTGILADESIFVAETPEEFRELLAVAMKKEVTAQVKSARELQVSRFDNRSNAARLVNAVFYRDKG